AESEGRKVNILLRVNPDYVPREMNQGSATGSRKGCAFGLDLKGGEVEGALQLLRKQQHISFQGFHFHIGTGIRHSRDYSNALRCLPILIREARSAGFRIQVFDVGGGFASMSTKEFTTSEMLLYQWLGKLPSRPVIDRAATFRDFTREISNTLMSYFSLDELPELIYEPGRCIATPNQLLLLTVHHIKERYGVGKWLITDGGLGTVTMPTYYEYHEVFLCNDAHRPRTEKVTIIGPACFAGDVVYRNKWMPEVRPSEVLAVMDTGAYFTALESSFGFPRPAIVFVHDGESRLVRSRETFEEMIQRDHWNKKKINEEELS
ncbi:MAG: hypothetical protein HW374_858, partial [Bacteroidetes bacterium]|nr:hypothetical protein [Bacteroidota bacterium]